MTPDEGSETAKTAPEKVTCELRDQVVLEADDITKVYRLGDEVEVRALDGVSLQVCRGEMLSIMGPSGSGKSTLMHLIGLLDTPSSGSVQLEGVEVSQMSPDELSLQRNKRIGFVFQSFNLLARTSAVDNVELPLIYSGMSASDRRKHAVAELQKVGLGDRLNNQPSQLSGGQQQRVAIARALVNNPSIVLADEPTGNLDSKSGIDVMVMLQELEERGITVVLVTHDANIARHATRVVEMADGKIVDDRVVEDRLFARDRREAVKVGTEKAPPVAAGEPEAAPGAGDAS